MIIKVDRVQSTDQIDVLNRFNIQWITLSLRGQVEPNFKILESLGNIQYQGKLGIYYNPHLNPIAECTKVIETGLIQYIQIEYSQLMHPRCIALRQRHKCQVFFVCDSIIADSDSELGWVELAIEDAIEWGCKLNIINLFSDRQRGWKDFVSNSFDFRIVDLEALLTNYQISICCDFQSSDISMLAKYQETLVINLKLDDPKNLSSHYHSFCETIAFLTAVNSKSDRP